MPVLMLFLPRPSRLTSTLISVSFVFLSTVAVRAVAAASAIFCLAIGG